MPDRTALIGTPRRPPARTASAIIDREIYLFANGVDGLPGYMRRIAYLSRNL